MRKRPMTAFKSSCQSRTLPACGGCGAGRPHDPFWSRLAICFPPHFAHRLVEEWLGREEWGPEERPDEPVIGHTRIAGREMPIQRFVGIPRIGTPPGEIEQ